MTQKSNSYYIKVIIKYEKDTHKVHLQFNLKEDANDC